MYSHGPVASGSLKHPPTRDEGHEPGGQRRLGRRCIFHNGGDPTACPAVALGGREAAGLDRAVGGMANAGDHSTFISSI